MLKVLVLDYVGNSVQWLQDCTLRDKYEIVKTLTPDSEKSDVALLMTDIWDYLLVFENGMRNVFEKIVEMAKISTEQYIYALDWNSWAEHPAAIYSLLNPNGGGAVRVYSFEF